MDEKLQQYLIEQKSPDDLIDNLDDFNRAGRIRIYKLCDYIQGILDGRVKLK